MKINEFGRDGKRLSRREFIGSAAAVGIGAVLAGGAGKVLASMAPPTKNAIATVPSLIINDPANFKILQITDTHFNFVAAGYLADPERMKKLKMMVAIFKPDIIVNTGDFWANKTDKGADTCKMICKEWAKLKTPWAFAWGNHDECTDYNYTHSMLEKTPYLLYCGAEDGNYRLEIKTIDNAAPVWNFIMLNDSRGGIRQEQIDWFNAEVGRIKKETPAPPPAFLFFHIPIPQYENVAAPGKAVGVKFEGVSHEGGTRDAFPAFRDAGFVKAMFCGHDHVNDYHGDIDGIRLQYGRALGGYGEDRVRKGGTLITVDTTKGTYETLSVFPDGTSVTYDKFIDKPEHGKIY